MASLKTSASKAASMAHSATVHKQTSPSSLELSTVCPLIQPAKPNKALEIIFMDREELLKRWGFPHKQRHGVTLVSRKDAAACVTRIYKESCRFHGYDAFTIHPDNKIEPHLEWSPSWERGETPTREVVLDQLNGHPPEVTHY